MEAWERSTKRTIGGGLADAASLPRGPEGRALCRWCVMEVPRGRRTFCSDYCVHEWRLRSDSGYLREKLFERDRGVCASCGVDAAAAWIWIRKQRGGRRTMLLREWGLRTMSRSSLWDADHVVPVAEGGGECDLSNMRTLCLKCHRTATAGLRERLAIRAIVSQGVDPPRLQCDSDRKQAAARRDR